MATPGAQRSRRIGNRVWIFVLVVIIIGLSVVFSFDWTAATFRVDAWSTFISGVQISTLVVVLALLFVWVRSREPQG